MDHAKNIDEAIQQIAARISLMTDDEIFDEIEKRQCSGGLEFLLIYASDYTYTWDKYMGQCMRWFRDMWE